MKIGAFAKQYNVSIDTIRHYMDLGLLYPVKKGGQYDFNKLMHIEMDKIVMLKEFGLTLAEISHYMYFNRLSVLDNRDVSIDISFFEGKLKQIQTQIKTFKTYEAKLQNHINDFSEIVRKQQRPLGIPIFDIQLIGCPQCHSDMVLNATNIANNQVFDGTLTCSCGHSMAIVSGILINCDVDISTIQAAEFDIVDYISETPMGYYNTLTQTMEWIRSKLLNQLTKDAVMLELGTGYGIFLRSCYQQFSRDTLYICIENDPEQLLYLKEIMEYYQPNGRLLFILGDFNTPPLKANTIDIILDIAGTTADQSTPTEVTYEHLGRIWRKEGSLLSATFLGDKFGPNSIVPTTFQPAYTERYFNQILHELNIKIHDTYKSNYLEPGGKYEQITTKGDKIFIYSVHGQNKEIRQDK